MGKVTWKCYLIFHSLLDFDVRGCLSIRLPFETRDQVQQYSGATIPEAFFQVVEYDHARHNGLDSYYSTKLTLSSKPVWPGC